MIVYVCRGLTFPSCFLSSIQTCLPNGGKIKTNHNVDGKTILSHTQQEIIHENVLKLNDAKVEVSMGDASQMFWDLATFLNIKRTWRNSRKAVALFCTKWRLSLQKINERRRMTDMANYLEISNVFTWQTTLLMKLHNIPLENVHFMDQTSLSPHRPDKSLAPFNEGKYLSTNTSDCTKPETGLLQIQGRGQFENLGMCFQEISGVLGKIVERKTWTPSHA